MNVMQVKYVRLPCVRLVREAAGTKGLLLPQRCAEVVYSGVGVNGSCTPENKRQPPPAEDKTMGRSHFHIHFGKSGNFHSPWFHMVIEE